MSATIVDFPTSGSSSSAPVFESQLADFRVRDQRLARPDRGEPARFDQLMRDAQKLPPRGLVYASIYRRHVLAMLRCENALELVDLMRSIDLLAAGSLEFKGGPDYWGPEIDMGAPFLRWRYETSQTDAEHLSIALTNMDGSESFRLRVFAWEGGKVSRRGHANYLCYCRPPRHEYDYDHKSSRGIRTAWAFKWILGYGWSCGQFPETDEGKSVRAPFKGCGKGWELGRLQPTITLER